MANQFADRVLASTTTTGTTSPINLGAAVSGFRSFGQAVTDGHLSSGASVLYVITDGANWETGQGTFTTGSPATLSRSVSASSNSGSLISLSGAAQVGITLTANGVSAIEALTLTGDATGSASNGTLTATLAASGVSAGTFSNLTIDAKGRTTAARAINQADINAAIASSSFTYPVTTPVAAITSTLYVGPAIGPQAQIQQNSLQTPALLMTFADSEGGGEDPGFFSVVSPNDSNGGIQVSNYPKSGSWMIASVGRIGGTCGHGVTKPYDRCSPAG